MRHAKTAVDGDRLRETKANWTGDGGEMLRILIVVSPRKTTDGA